MIARFGKGTGEAEVLDVPVMVPEKEHTLIR